MLAERNSLLHAQKVRPPLVNPSTHLGDGTHQAPIQLLTVYDILHVRVDMTGKVMVQESPDV